MPSQYFALIDDRLVEDAMFLRRGLGMPRLLSPQPVVDPGESLGAVLRDRDGLWRMWYCVYVIRDPQVDLVGCDTPECIAYSRDGITWEKPALNLVDDPLYAKHPNAIIGPKQRDANGRYLSGWGGPSGLDVLDAAMTPHPCARARFTGLTTSFPIDTIGGVCLMHSDDGIAWTAYPENPVIIGSPDTQNTLLWDARIGKYVCYLRPTVYCGVERHANRKMARAESDDLIHWTPPRVVLDTDERDAPAFDIFDEPGMNGPRGRAQQFQGMSPFILNGCYLAFTWFYDARQGIFWNELIHSDDGLAWKREALREPFTGDGRPAGFRGKLFVPAAGAPILVGDEYYFYQCAMPFGHHDGATADIDPDKPNRATILESTSIYGLAIKRDRWIGYEAGDYEGELLTTPLDWEGGSPLYLNCEVEDGGYITVEVEDQWGRPVKDAHLDEIPPIAGPLDAVDHLVPFGPGPKTIMRFPPIGPIRFRFRLRNATLYGWSFRSAGA